MKDDNAWTGNLPDREQRHDALNSQGKDVAMYPFAGWSTGTMASDGIVVAIEFLIPSPDLLLRILRLQMTRAQCAELAKGLDLVARTPHVPPSETC
jgi:hypothetical protein